MGRASSGRLKTRFFVKILLDPTRFVVQKPVTLPEGLSGGAVDGEGSLNRDWGSRGGGRSRWKGERVLGLGVFVSVGADLLLPWEQSDQI